MCRRSLPKYALLLAQKHEKHEWFLRIQIENNKKYTQALEYIATLGFKEACVFAKKYGRIFMDNIPNEITQFLKILCTEYVSHEEQTSVTVNFFRDYIVK